MSEVVLGKVSVDKGKRWADTDERLAKIRQEVTDLLFECGHSITKPLVDDIAVIVLNHQIDAFYAKDLGEL